MGPQQQTRCVVLLLWARPAGDSDRLLHQRRVAGECGQCHVASVRRLLNTDTFVSFSFSECLGFVCSKIQGHTELQITKSDPSTDSYNHYQITALYFEHFEQI